MDILTQYTYAHNDVVKPIEVKMKNIFLLQNFESYNKKLQPKVKYVLRKH